MLEKEKNKNNDGSLKKGLKNQLKDPNDQIWNNLSNKINDDSNGTQKIPDTNK